MSVKSGDRVKVEYRGTLKNGALFDETKQGEPIEVQLGEDQLIVGVEKALIGMEPGEHKNITVLPEEGYGAVQEGLTAKVERSQLPDDIEIKAGMIMEIRSTDGKTSMNVTIAEVLENHVIIDANHPLAGKELNFYLKLVEVV